MREARDIMNGKAGADSYGAAAAMFAALGEQECHGFEARPHIAAD
jgi:hypothetical protein